MSWITGLAGKAEDFLNRVDQTAATALQKEDEERGRSRRTEFTPSSTETQHYSPYFTQTKSPAPRPDTLSPKTPPNNGNLTVSASVPSNLNKLENSHSNRSSKKTTPNGSARQSPVRSTKKDMDEELFEFLNSKDSVDSGTKRKSGSFNGKISLNGSHSRESSGSSTTSTPTGAKTPEAPPVSISVTSSEGTPSEKSVNGVSDVTETSADDINPEDAQSMLGTEPSSGYVSNHEDAGSTGAQQHLSSLELENRLLQNEVTQLNQEMTSVIERAREAQEDLARVKRKLDDKTRSMSRTDQEIRELRSRESDLQEALGAKDAQLAILRVRLEEADKELEAKSRLIVEIQQENDRILNDHSSASGVQSQALDSLKFKLQEAEENLRREQEALRKVQQEALHRQSTLETEKQNLAEELSSLQRKAHEDKAKFTDMAAHLQVAKQQVDSSKTELSEYKEKATRILQSKDKLIASLKEGARATGGPDSGVSFAEIEEMRQERDMYREEVQRAQITTESLRNEIAELELQLQQDSDSTQDQISGLEDQLRSEKERRDDAEHEVNKHKQELRYAHEELLKQKTAFQSRIQDREIEIERLRSQLTNKNMSTSSQAELENRLHTLTESLIQKQTMLEALSTEKNSLILQLERTEKQYREAESSALRATSTAVNINEDDEVRNRLPLFMRESPLDGDVTRRVKRAANTIDRFSMKLGVFLRRYPMARIFVIMYMALLHFWVSIVLLTYNPEVHNMDYQPRPPQ